VSGRARPLAAAGALLALAACGGGAASPSHPSSAPVAGSSAARAVPSPSPSGTPTALPVRVSSRGTIHFTEQKRNRTVYTMEAASQSAQRAPSGDGVSVFEKPHVTFYPLTGKTLVADAPTGTVNAHGKIVTVLMSGRVHAHTGDGIALVSDTLQYDDADETVHARGNVVLTTATERLEGGALDADLRFSHVRLTPGP